MTTEVWRFQVTFVDGKIYTRATVSAAAVSMNTVLVVVYGRRPSLAGLLDSC